MNKQKAIEELYRFLNHCGKNRSSVYVPECVEAIKTAIDALSRQIPKKPMIKREKTITHINYSTGYGERKEIHYRILICPECKSYIRLAKKSNFCPICGQAIDWSETNG